MKYRQLENPVKIHKTQMTRNFDIEKLKDSILPNKTGFFLYTSGAASSGKTTAIMSLLNNEYKNVFNKITIYSPSSHTIGKKLKLPEECFKPDLSTLEDDYNDIRKEYKTNLSEGLVISTLIVIDDLIADISKADKVMKSIVFNRAHSDISLIITSQKYKSLPLEYRCNASHIITFPTLNNKELQAIIDESDIFYNQKSFRKVLVDMFSKKFNFLYIDLINKKAYNKFEYEIIEEDEEKNVINFC